MNKLVGAIVALGFVIGVGAYMHVTASGDDATSSVVVQCQCPSGDCQCPPGGDAD